MQKETRWKSGVPGVKSFQDHEPCRRSCNKDVRACVAQGPPQWDDRDPFGIAHMRNSFSNWSSVTTSVKQTRGSLTQDKWATTCKMKIVRFQTQKRERLLRKTRKVTQPLNIYYVPANFAILPISGMCFGLKIQRMTTNWCMISDQKMHETKLNYHFNTLLRIKK